MSVLFGPSVAAPISPLLSLPFFSLLFPFFTLIAPRRVSLFHSFVIGMRVMVQIDSHPLALSENESRRRLRRISPLPALEPVISLNSRIMIDFVVRIVIVRFHAAGPWCFRDQTAGRK